MEHCTLDLIGQCSNLMRLNRRRKSMQQDNKISVSRGYGMSVNGLIAFLVHTYPSSDAAARTLVMTHPQIDQRRGPLYFLNSLQVRAGPFDQRSFHPHSCLQEFRE